ncbi:Protein of unknown function [Pyronema omphalodes CBS 100304]|uniref:Uncharacterized protein n=1 Tax=Pyronema omphalodes (strain CBS 100304) TaxID=1076935 RepID=U4L1T4_PYROM|nr:Protein of unknown function [Pyronema omphalodes CBS 100304]
MKHLTVFLLRVHTSILSVKFHNYQPSIHSISPSSSTSSVCFL